jgi:hypothetical protein
MYVCTYLFQEHQRSNSQHKDQACGISGKHHPSIYDPPGIRVIDRQHPITDDGGRQFWNPCIAALFTRVPAGYSRVTKHQGLCRVDLLLRSRAVLSSHPLLSHQASKVVVLPSWANIFQKPLLYVLLSPFSGCVWLAETRASLRPVVCGWPTSSQRV